MSKQNFTTCVNPKTYRDVIIQQHDSLVVPLYLNRHMLKMANIFVPPSLPSSSSSLVLPKTMCVWWSTAILCIAANSWNEPLWVGCAPSWNVRSPAWNTWSKVVANGASSLSEGSSRLLTYCSLPIFLRQCGSICLVCPPSTPTQEPCSCVVTPMSESLVSSTRYADACLRCLQAVIIITLWKKTSSLLSVSGDQSWRGCPALRLHH